jgi:hypothetical protein
VSAERYVFDAPVQALRAGDRIIRCPEPELAGATVIYVRASRAIHEEPSPYGPVSVITRELEEPPSVGWGSRCIIERVPEPDDPYLVSGREPLGPSSRLEVRATMALELTRGDLGMPEEHGEVEAGTRISTLVDGGFLDRVPERGELIDAYWYVDDHRVETPSEQGAREAADLFAGHAVRLRPAGGDAGETCPSCGGVVSWVEHLPPLRSGQLVRCMVRRPRAAS